MIKVEKINKKFIKQSKNKKKEEFYADKDISFYHGLAESYIPVKPGMFAIFFPQDAHAPGVSPDGVKKVIVKVLV